MDAENQNIEPDGWLVQEKPVCHTWLYM